LGLSKPLIQKLANMGRAFRMKQTRRNISIAIIVTLAISACAKSPDAIVPVSMVGAYDDVSCKKASTMITQERSTLATLSSQQESAVTGDAVGVLLIGVPMSSVSGQDVEGSIAASKGKILALEARLQSC
jgi:hypothetical protein